jgi:putative membrane-bound dehydrogenase-like protein
MEKHEMLDRSIRTVFPADARHFPFMLRYLLRSLMAPVLSTASAAADFSDRGVDKEALPSVADGFEVRLFAKEPLVSNPAAMAFDGKGRLFVGMGPQWRNPKPDSPKDSVCLIEDRNGDGVAEYRHVFATGFNSVQSIAWRGRDLWVANSPDLTVVRDLDGDDVADEYVKVFTDLGNIEHCLHGLNWGPDGRLYMSKGNSKGVSLGGDSPKEPGRIAPKAFRELWGWPGPKGAPDLPSPQTFTRETYKATYQDPADDWGQTGGILRYDPSAPSLEIYARGFRNPWDIAFDSSFNWLGTDNDQTGGDRVFMPFRHAHFGWGHAWSPAWPGGENPATAPNSGQIIEGSYAGIEFADSPHFPESHRGVWFIADWMRKQIYLYRPEWSGALNVPRGGRYEEFVRGGTALFRPTDMAMGPDGALWALGWGTEYGSTFDARGQQMNEGRIYRIVAKDRPLVSGERNAKPLEEWRFDELLAGLGSWIPARRTDARDELLRRGKASIAPLQEALARPVNTAQETWAVWTLARLASAEVHPASENQRLQLVRAGVTSTVTALRDAHPRIRLAAVEAAPASQRSALIDLLAAESDRIVYHSAWRAVMAFSDAAAIRELAADPRPRVRLAGVLMRMEQLAMTGEEALPLLQDSDETIRTLAGLWLSKVKGSPQTAAPAASAVPDAWPLAHNIHAESRRDYAAGTLREGESSYTDRRYRLKKPPAFLEGSTMIRTANEDDGSSGDAFLTFESPLDVAVYVAHDERAKTKPPWLAAFGDSDSVVASDDAVYRLFVKDFPAGTITLGGNTPDGKPGGKGHYFVILAPRPPAPPAVLTTPGAVLAALPKASPQRGAALFLASGGAGCALCHKVAGSGHDFGPDLTGAGDRFDARHLIDSMLNPGAVITEGFAMMNVKMKDGTSHSGVLREQSALALTLALPGGQTARLDRTHIAQEEMLPVSAMPPFGLVLDAQRVADITAWPLTQKTAANDGANNAPAPGEGFQVTRQQDRLIIARSGQPVAHYVFRDDRILRPYFARVHAPGGIQLTRSHPPVKGVDATDHDTMHPGLSMGFGDLNGVDFWRNQGRIEHRRFVREPVVKDGRLTFAVEERCMGGDGAEICQGVHEFCFVAGSTLQPAVQGTLLLWSTRLSRADGPLTFGPQHEMGLGFRMATPLAVKAGHGAITGSHGGVNEKGNWGRAGSWWDY